MTHGPHFHMTLKVTSSHPMGVAVEMPDIFMRSGKPRKSSAGRLGLEMVMSAVPLDQPCRHHSERGTWILSGSPLSKLGKAPGLAGLVYTVMETRCKMDVLLPLDVEELLRPLLSSNTISPWHRANHSRCTAAFYLVERELLWCD